MPYEFTPAQEAQIARQRTATNDRLTAKTAAVVFLLLQEMATQISSRIKLGQYPIPTGGPLQWAQRLLMGQLADGRSAALLGYNSAASLMTNLGRKTPPLSDSSLEAGFMYKDIDVYFTEGTKRQANTITRKAESSFKKRMAEQNEDGSLKFNTEAAVAGAVAADMLQFSKTYAPMVASTGIVWASNSGSTRGYVKAGVVQWRWTTRKDSKVCPFCLELEDTVVAITSSFVRAGERFEAPTTNAAGEQTTVFLQMPEWNIHHPPLHANCRCFLLPHA